MAASTPRIELRLLKRFVEELKKRYLSQHLSRPMLGPISRAEELDVAAFAVLTHGALENFAEGLALWAVSRVETNWIHRRRASKSTATLLMNSSFSIKIEEETRSTFDIMRGALDSAKTAHSKTVQDNHGAGMKYLRTLLLPLGVDMPTDVSWIASLDTLVIMRHQWAHQYRFGARQSKTAGDAVRVADDCVLIAEKLCANMVALHLS